MLGLPYIIYPKKRACCFKVMLSPGKIVTPSLRNPFCGDGKHQTSRSGVALLAPANSLNLTHEAECPIIQVLDNITRLEDGRPLAFSVAMIAVEVRSTKQKENAIRRL